MGEWKASVSLRIKPELRVEMEQFAAVEQRSLGNIGALLLVWAFDQLKAVGSTERLLKLKVQSPEGVPKQRHEGPGTVE